MPLTPAASTKVSGTAAWVSDPGTGVRHAFTGTLLNMFQDIRLPLFHYGRLPVKRPLEQVVR
jgi:hypothetical protein